MSVVCFKSCTHSLSLGIHGYGVLFVSAAWKDKETGSGTVVRTEDWAVKSRHKTRLGWACTLQRLRLYCLEQKKMAHGVFRLCKIQEGLYEMDALWGFFSFFTLLEPRLDEWVPCIVWLHPAYPKKTLLKIFFVWLLRPTHIAAFQLTSDVLTNTSGDAWEGSRCWMKCSVKRRQCVW